MYIYMYKCKFNVDALGYTISKSCWEEGVKVCYKRKWTTIQQIIENYA